MVWWRPPEGSRVGWRYALRLVKGPDGQSPWLVPLERDAEKHEWRPGWWPWEEHRPSAKKVLTDFEQLANGWPGGWDLTGKTATLVGLPSEPAFGSLIETFVRMHGSLFEPGTYELTASLSDASPVADTFGEPLGLWDQELRYAAGVFSLWRVVELLSDSQAAYKGVEILRASWLKPLAGSETASGKGGFRWWWPERYWLGVPPRWRVDPDDEADMLRAAVHALSRLINRKLRNGFDLRLVPGSSPQLAYVPTSLLALVYGQLAANVVQRFRGARTMYKRECANLGCQREARTFFTTDRRTRYCSDECSGEGRKATARMRAQRYYNDHKDDIQDRRGRGARQMGAKGERSVPDE